MPARIVYYAAWRPERGCLSDASFYHSDSVVVKGKKPITNFSHYGLVDANGDGKIDSIDPPHRAGPLGAQRPEARGALERGPDPDPERCGGGLPLIRLKYTFPQKSYVDLGYPLEWSWQTYSPQITEKTKILAHK